MAPEPRAALQALLQDVNLDDHDAILKAANAAIKANKGDLIAQKARVVALLKLDRFQKALRAITDGGAKLAADCVFEKAYALYKGDKLEQAAATVKASPLDSRKFQHVAAQIAYRNECFDEAEALYERLLADDGAAEEHDLRINLAGTRAQRAWRQDSRPIEPDRSPPKPPSSFEVCYNDACALIARESYDQAANLLQRAMRLCDASDDFTEEKKAELAPILAQQAFTFSKLGNTEKALGLYQSLDADNISEADFALLVEINKRALQPSSDDPFLVRRSVDARNTAAANAKLFTYQSNILAHNLAALDIATYKEAGLRRRSCRQMAQVRGPTIRSDVNQASILNAAAATCGKPERQQARKIASMCEQRPENVGLLLTMVQLRIRDGKPGAALSFLQSFLARIDRATDTEASDVRHSPGLVALTVALLQAQSKHASAKVELIKAIKYWLKRPESAKTVATLMKETGVALARCSSAEELSLAASALQSLDPAYRSNPIVSAGLVAALAATAATSQLSEDVARLPPVDSLTSGVDVDALASAGVVLPPPKSGVSSSSAKKRAAPEDEALGSDKPAKKRKRRRLPKNYDPKVAPDPERWLPLRDRASYRRKAKKGGKKAFETTQGGLVKEGERLGLAGGEGAQVEKRAGSSSRSQAKQKPKKGRGKR